MTLEPNVIRLKCEVVLRGFNLLQLRLNRLLYFIFKQHHARNVILRHRNRVARLLNVNDLRPKNNQNSRSV